ncbi:hypothetical protein L3081_25905 [Colwellia sp. MSW7]|uniref:Amidohydrolase 3 domain-containing protein n=1 Tax=Colwellia maritima TaxID=2912588 RepID=A0ABS9X7M6_9GAMM|nr:hypothetical protein [Colwellia maritima]MCI2286236.1 hypothetical protein [Colwellia maritima]
MAIYVTLGKSLEPQDGQFIAVGNRETMTPHIDQHTKVVDLQGRFAMPGLYDMHTHPDLTYSRLFRLFRCRVGWQP